MIDIKMNLELFNAVKVPLLLTSLVVLLIIIITAYFVSREVKNDIRCNA